MDLFFQNQMFTVKEIMELNRITKNCDLALKKQEILSLIDRRDMILSSIGRVEVGEGILKDLILAFYDSPFIDKDNYFETVSDLLDIFYFYQTEFSNLTDEEIINYMRDSFDNLCAGSLEMVMSVGVCNLKESIKENLYG